MQHLSTFLTYLVSVLSSHHSYFSSLFLKFTSLFLFSKSMFILWRKKLNILIAFNSKFVYIWFSGNRIFDFVSVLYHSLFHLFSPEKSKKMVSETFVRFIITQSNALMYMQCLHIYAYYCFVTSTIIKLPRFYIESILKTF